MSTRPPPNDVNAWYEANPSLGSILTERKIADLTVDGKMFTKAIDIWLIRAEMGFLTCIFVEILKNSTDFANILRKNKAAF